VFAEYYGAEVGGVDGDRLYRSGFVVIKANTIYLRLSKGALS
jgi:hypothetical protein